MVDNQAPKECNEVGGLRINLWLASEKHPQTHPEVIQAIQDLRVHFATCETCKAYLKYYANLNPQQEIRAML